jgi:UDP-GlcNAc3NAcA epimerase
MKIITIIGARPQFIKAAVLSAALAKYKDLQEIIIHTGQHYDANMSDIFFDELKIPKPAYNLSIGGGTHGQNTGRMIETIEEVLINEKPDMVLVYGDTDSTLAGALAACKLHIPVAHVEAGLRSYNRRMPEEINRVLTDQVSTLLFAPTEGAKNNLIGEGGKHASVHVVGDVMYDATVQFRDIAEKHSKALETYNLAPKDYILATIHRAENTNDPERMSGILEGLKSSALKIVLPLHPRTRGVLKNQCFKIPDNIQVIDPIGYFDMQVLEANAKIIATDSGGVQKEAYFHGVPCITLRDETEWVELVAAKANILTGADAAKIKDAIANFMTHDIQVENIYGDGTAAQTIADILHRWK